MLLCFYARFFSEKQTNRTPRAHLVQSDLRYSPLFLPEIRRSRTHLPVRATRFQAPPTRAELGEGMGGKGKKMASMQKQNPTKSYAVIF